MRLIWISFLCVAGLAAQPQVDNVLIRMVPPGAASLMGARMDRIETTAFYRDLLNQQKLPQLDRFAAETGFDPRRDVREFLFADSPAGGVLLARGAFHPKGRPVEGEKQIRYKDYAIHVLGTSGYCILDPTLAAAGDLTSLKAALDEWKSGEHTAGKLLLSRGQQIAPLSQFWGVSTGFAGFIADSLPHSSSGVDFSRIFRGLEDTWFEADFTSGLKGRIHGSAATEKDAMNLRDAAKGLIGFGRLSVPENQPEMLKLWDGIQVEQQDRSISIRADIPQELIRQLVQMMSAAGPRARGSAPVLR